MSPTAALRGSMTWMETRLSSGSRSPQSAKDVPALPWTGPPVAFRWLLLHQQGGPVEHHIDGVSSRLLNLRHRKQKAPAIGTHVHAAVGSIRMEEKPLGNSA